MIEKDQEEIRLRTLEFNVEQLHLKTDETFIVNTDCGRVKGVKRRTIYDNNYYSFERIPYAQPPLGELRFQAPRPIKPWPNVLDCTHYGPKAVQRNPITGAIEGSEDCLHLNVYTNNLTPVKPRAVMVWIHGGGYKFGEATREWYGPDYFMKRDVILVTVQYRLDALGFLCLRSPHLKVAGNAGLKDQILALRWIKRNCRSFGGNPDCITVFGESAGGESTHLLMLSEQARGLFHRAIAQSGFANSDWAISLDCVNRSYSLAQAAGYRGPNNEREILEFLLSCTAEEITKAKHDSLTAEDKANIDLMAFGPTLEPYLTSHTVLTKMPSELFANAWSNEMPFILGATSKEALGEMPESLELIEEALKTCESLVPRDALNDSSSKQERLEKGLILRSLHVNGGKAPEDDYADIFSHKFFWHPIATTILARLKHARTSNNSASLASTLSSSSTASSPYSSSSSTFSSLSVAPTYLYRFDFDSNKLINPFRLLRNGRDVPGVAHADDLSFLFTNVLTCRMETDSREYRTIERMIGLWTRFAETGNPNAADGDMNGTNGVQWQALQQNDLASFKCLNISDALEFMELPEMAKIKVWQSLKEDTKEDEIKEE